jgi:hypothetical protein
MWMVAALAFMPIVAVSFGALAALIAIFPEATQDFGLGAALLYGAAGLSVIIAIPLAVLVARRMMARRAGRPVRG